MARNTVHGGTSDMAADQDEARRNLLAQGNADPSPDQVDAELQNITDKRAASAHLAQPGETSVTPESQAAKMAATGAEFGDADATPDVPADPDSTAGDAAGDGNDAEDPDAFDPADYTVEDVNAYLADLADDDDGNAERERVLSAERAGKNRVTITG